MGEMINLGFGFKFYKNAGISSTSKERELKVYP
jgi:hypothetical protein